MKTIFYISVLTFLSRTPGTRHSTHKPLLANSPSGTDITRERTPPSTRDSNLPSVCKTWRVTRLLDSGCEELNRTPPLACIISKAAATQDTAVRNACSDSSQPPTSSLDISTRTALLHTRSGACAATIAIVMCTYKAHWLPCEQPASALRNLTTYKGRHTLPPGGRVTAQGSC